MLGVRRSVLRDHFLLPPPARPEFAKRSMLVGPLLRAEVLGQRAERDNYILIYATTPEAREALALAERTRHEYVAYGFDRCIAHPVG